MNETKNLLKRMRKENKKNFNFKYFAINKNIKKSILFFFIIFNIKTIETLIAN